MGGKLPNAPLLEVIFELRWMSNSEDAKTKYQYLHGDLYSSLKTQYPHRELVVPSHFPVEVYLNQVAHRFRYSEGGYPLVQVGPGIFTVNTVEQKYVWVDFCEETLRNVETLLNLESFNNTLPVGLSLKYFDFLPFNFDQDDIIDFLSKFLHIKVEQEFFRNETPPYNLNLGFTYGTNAGNLNLILDKGSVNNIEGIVIRIEVIQQDMEAKLSEIKKWLTDAHSLTSETFVNLTKGELQKQFQTKK